VARDAEEAPLRTTLIVIGVIIVVLVAASFVTAEAFSSNDACNSCTR